MHANELSYYPTARLPVLSPNDVRGGRRDSSHLHGKVAHKVINR